MRADKKRNIAKVAKEILKNPLLTEKEIAQKTKLGKWTIHRAKKEVEKNGVKDDRIVGITETDLKIVQLAQNEIERRLKKTEELEKMRTIEISQVAEKSAARYMLFRGNATDEKWGLKLPILTEEQKIKIAQQYEY